MKLSKLLFANLTLVMLVLFMPLKTFADVPRSAECKQILNEINMLENQLGRVSNEMDAISNHLDALDNKEEAITRTLGNFHPKSIQYQRAYKRLFDIRRDAQELHSERKLLSIEYRDIKTEISWLQKSAKKYCARAGK